jgi:hypothetical protein
MKENNQNIELITTNAIGFPPFVFHRAIKFYDTKGNPLIIHRSTSGVEIVDFGTFMRNRHIISHERYPIRYTFDPVKLMKEDKKPFDWMNNNCEDFASEVIEQTTGQDMKPRSPQRCLWIGIVAVILLFMILIKL